MHKNVVFVGDFNFHVNIQTDTHATRFLDALNMLSLENNVEGKTYKNSENTLDLVVDSYVNKLVFNVSVCFETTFSDHAVVKFNILSSLDQRKKVVKTLEYPLYSVESKKKISDHLNSSYHDFTLNRNDPSQLMNSMNRILSYGKTNFVETAARTIHEVEINPWYNSNCREAKREKRRIERKYYKNKPAYRTEYRAAVRKSVKCLKSTKSDYFNEAFSKYKSNPKKSFNFVNMLLGRKQDEILPDLSAEQPQLYVDTTLSHVHNKILTYRREIDSKNVPKRVVFGTGSHKLEQFQEISMEKLNNLMSRCRITSCVFNTIDYSRIDLDPLKPYFLEIINSCFRTGSFPASEKFGDISPLIKDRSGDKNDQNNYRPITHVSHPSKLVELETYDQLSELVELNNVLPDNQSAYRRYHSTETALTKIYSDLIVSKDKGKCSIMILLDLSAAFDTVDHELLISDLFQYGLRGRALDFISSYLKGRSIQVTAVGHTSATRPLLFGVPQGSVLGPLLFIIYTQSLSAVLEDMGVNFHMYADDTQIYFEFDADKVPDVKSKLTTIFRKTMSWMLSRKLKLNMNKFKIIIFSTPRHKQQVLDDFGTFVYDDIELSPCSEVKNLGVIFDEDLSFRQQINSTIRNCNFALLNLKGIKIYVPHKLFIELIISEVLSRLDYGNILLLLQPKYQLERLQQIMNRAARIIFNVPYRESITPYLQDRLHWLPMAPRMDYKGTLMAHKAVVHKSPVYIYNLLDIYSSRRGQNQLRHRTVVGGHEFAFRAFFYAVPIIYNKIPRNVKEHGEDMEKFKKDLKTYFFTEGFEYKLDSIVKYTPSGGIYTRH